MRRLAALVNRAAYGPEAGSVAAHGLVVTGEADAWGGQRPGRPGPRRPRPGLGPLAAPTRSPAPPPRLRRFFHRTLDESGRGLVGPRPRLRLRSRFARRVLGEVEHRTDLVLAPAAVAPDDEEHQHHAEDEQGEPVAAKNRSTAWMGSSNASPTRRIR